MLCAAGRREVVERDETKTEAGVRVVWLDAATVAVLRAWRKQQITDRLAWGSAWANTDGHVFTTEDGRPVDPESVTRRFAMLAARHGLPKAKLRRLRHYRAASLISVGSDIAVVSKMMGHSSVAVTSDIYGSLFEVAGRELPEKAAELVPRNRAA